MGGEPPLGVLHPVEQFSQPVVHAVPGGHREHHRVQPLFPRPGQQRIQLAATLFDTVPEQHGHAQIDPQVCKPEKRRALLRVVDDIDAIGEGGNSPHA